MLQPHSIGAQGADDMDLFATHSTGDAALVAASLAFAAATVFGSVVAARNDVPGEPLGIHASFSTTAGIAIGWGAGVAAPWPMPLTAVIVASGRSVRRRGAICAAVGAMCIAGTAVEPVTWRRRRWNREIAAALAANLAASAGMIGAGLYNRSRAG